MKLGKSYRITTSSSSYLHSLPMEWLDSRSWRLPSGQALAEFALQAGFLAPLLLRRDITRGKPLPKTERIARGVASKPVVSEEC
jgi:hypothetical protein